MNLEKHHTNAIETNYHSAIYHLLKSIVKRYSSQTNTSTQTQKSEDITVNRMGAIIPPLHKIRRQTGLDIADRVRIEPKKNHETTHSPLSVILLIVEPINDVIKKCWLKAAEQLQIDSNLMSVFTAYNAEMGCPEYTVQLGDHNYTENALAIMNEYGLERMPTATEYAALLSLSSQLQQKAQNMNAIIITVGNLGSNFLFDFGNPEWGEKPADATPLVHDSQKQITWYLAGQF